MKTRYILFLMLCATLLCGCEDMLERTPKDKMTPGTFFKTATECQMYTNTYYTLLPSAAAIYNEGVDVVAKDLLMTEIIGTRTVTSTDSNWKWDKLRDMNTFMLYSSNCPDLEVRREYEAVTRFFRAYFYFEKVKRFGDVPWFDEPLSSDDARLYKARDTREFVMQRMVEDIDFAIQYLPATKSVYRVTRWTALALKSRFCLFEGTFRKYHGQDDYQKYLREAIVAGTEFITSSGYGLYTSGNSPYQTLFTSQTAIDSEMILARGYQSSIGLTHDVNGHFNSPTMGKAGMLKNFINLYLMADGTSFTSKPEWQTMEFAAECANRDKRLAQTIRTPGYKRIDATTTSAPDYNSCISGYHIIKYVNAAKYDTYKTSTNDLPLFRTAEVWLNYAEALAELGELTQGDLDKTINKLRQRGGVTNLNMAYANAHPDPYLSAEQTGFRNVSGADKGVILEIRRERAIELVCEGFRYWDIMRWREGERFVDLDFHGPYFSGVGQYDLDSDGKADLCIWQGSKPSLGSSVVYKELNVDIFLSQGDKGNLVIPSLSERVWDESRDYLYPVPTDDRTLSSGKITQNPGWNDGLKF